MSLYEPEKRARLESAIKDAVADANLYIADVGRHLGKGAMWLASVLQRVRNGQALTVESVRTMRPVLPTIDDRLRHAGWEGSMPVQGRSLPATRSTEHLKLYLGTLLDKKDLLDREITDVRRQIAELEASHG